MFLGVLYFFFCLQIFQSSLLYIISSELCFESVSSQVIYPMSTSHRSDMLVKHIWIMINSYNKVLIVFYFSAFQFIILILKSKYIIPNEVSINLQEKLDLNEIENSCLNNNKTESRYITWKITMGLLERYPWMKLINLDRQVKQLMNYWNVICIT